MGWLRSLYSVAMTLAQPLLRRKLARRAAAEPGYAVAVEERFGHYLQPPWAPDARHPVVWVHAVSLGETRAAAVLIARLRAAVPGMRLLLTHGTATGRAQGQGLLREGDVQVWQPWDAPGAVARFLQHFRPRIGLLMETEVWPNLVAQCARHQVPLCLVNARLSEKSLASAQRLGWLARPAYRGLCGVWAQTEADAQRLAQLGAPIRGVMGNFKFDATPDEAQLQQGRAWRSALDKPVWLFASSREGEEAMLLEVLAQLRQDAATAQALERVQCLLVPRHPQRFDQVAQRCEAAGLRLSRRSHWGDSPRPAEVWLGDSMGEMALYFGLAHVALLGGSFAPLGGQNLIEAAACGCPVVTGPHTFNFEEAAEGAVAAGAALRVSDLRHGVQEVLRLLAQPEALAQLQRNALRWSQAHRGAADRTVEAIRGLLA